MKRIVKIGLLMIVLSSGFNKTSEAVEMQCVTGHVTCDNTGQQYNVLICGETYDERLSELIEATYALCEN